MWVGQPHRRVVPPAPGSPHRRPIVPPAGGTIRAPVGQLDAGGTTTRSGGMSQYGVGRLGAAELSQRAWDGSTHGLSHRQLDHPTCLVWDDPIVGGTTHIQWDNPVQWNAPVKSETTRSCWDNPVPLPDLRRQVPATKMRVVHHRKRTCRCLGIATSARAASTVTFQ